MLSEVVKSAIREPQIITVRGEEKAVVLSMDEYKKLRPKNQAWLNSSRSPPCTGLNWTFRNGGSIRCGTLICELSA
jgi:prevent-host-death family protein